MTGSSDPARSPADIVRSYLAALGARDPDLIASHVADDFVNEHVSERGDSLRGRAAYRHRLDSFLASFPELEYEVEDLVADRDRVVVAYRMRALRADPDQSRQPVPIDVRGVFWFTVRDRAIAHRIDYRDSATVERQLGLR